MHNATQNKGRPRSDMRSRPQTDMRSRPQTDSHSRPEQDAVMVDALLHANKTELQEAANSSLLENLVAAESAGETDSTSGFASFGLPERLQQALKRIGFTQPTPIQAQAIPVVLQGRDLLGSAQTGTGKTGAFGIPMLARLMAQPDDCALVLCPTRELATQVMAALAPMLTDTTLRGALLIGGEPMPRQFRQLQARPRLIVGTPGRVTDHLERGSLKLTTARFLVLDETDRMLDMGFGIQIDRILRFMPQERQTLLFSATLPQDIVRLAQKYMRDPVRVAVGSTTTPVANIRQELRRTSETEKHSILVSEIEARQGSIIIFMKTKFATERLADKLQRAGYSADAIHGALQQRRRTRVIDDFRAQYTRILVATDVAARGLDIPHVAHVINYDLPQCAEDYIHRIGRTARAGASGEALTLLTPADGGKWKAIQRLLQGTESQEGGNAHRGPGSQRPPSQRSESKRPGSGRPGSGRPESWGGASSRSGGRPYSGDSRREGGERFGRDAGERSGRDAGEGFNRDAGQRFGRDAGERFNRDGGEAAAQDGASHRGGGRPFSGKPASGKPAGARPQRAGFGGAKRSAGGHGGGGNAGGNGGGHYAGNAGGRKMASSRSSSQRSSRG